MKLLIFLQTEAARPRDFDTGVVWRTITFDFPTFTQETVQSKLERG